MTPKSEDVAAGRVLRRLRIDAGLSQADVGECIGVSYQQIQKYETGVNRMSISALFAIAACLTVQPSAFVSDIESEVGTASIKLERTASRSG